MKLKFIFVLLAITFIIFGCGGGGGGGGGGDDNTPTANRDMSGTWEGSFVSAANSTYISKFELIQNGTNITGEFEFTNQHGVQHTDDISGTINNSTVTISAIWTSQNDPDYSFEMIFEGDVDGNIYDGQMTAILTDEDNPDGSVSTYNFSFAGEADPDFSFSFQWGNIPLCNDGRPNTVNNPRFELNNVPAGTASIQFTMTDLDVPDYPHGGGTVQYVGQNIITPGAFQYQSPCPPNGSHRYEWTAIALNNNGQILAEATSGRYYP